MPSLALDLALVGVGVVLGQCMLAQHDLNAGRLVKLSPIAIGLRHTYCLIHPHSKVHKEGLMPLIE